MTAAMELKTLAPWKKSYDQPRQHIKRRDITLLLTNVHLKWSCMDVRVGL